MEKRKSDEPAESMTINGDKASFTGFVHHRVRNLDDLIAEVKIDTNVWDIEKWVCNKWEVSAWDRKARRFVLQDLWQVKVWLTRSKDKAELRQMADVFLKQIRAQSVKVPKLAPKKAKHPYLCEVDLFDFHLGKMTWGKETGEDYDLKIARKLFVDTIGRLLVRARRFEIERFLFPIGNDFFNVNGSAAATFGGTPQSEDDRWKKTFAVGWQLIIETIESLAEIAPVDVLVVPGNHDFESAFYLGEVVGAHFHNNPNVKVDNSPPVRKYYRYGYNLIGFTHGRDEKLSELPLIMATERPQDFAETKYREWHYGDKHHKKEYSWLSVDEQKGVTLRMMRSLSTNDEWHYMKGYIGNIRAGEAFLWDKQEGLACSLSANL